MDRYTRAAIGLALPVTLAAAGCGRTSLVDLYEDEGPPANVTADAGKERLVDARAEVSSLPPGCAGSSVPPNSLECTGLYDDIATKRIASVARPYTPAVPLWADGADKQRWIELPAGTTIDRTDPSEWTFPIGTKVWKEFSKYGQRIETRLFQKVQASYWVYGTYQWNADQTAATLSPGGQVVVPHADGGTWYIPTFDECQQCHGGRSDRLLGFEEVSLGLTGATGLTLEALAREGLLRPPPASTRLTVGDDGTGLAALPLEWLHVNCGTTCHNTNPNATEYALGMVLRLDPTELDGRPAGGFPSILTTVGVAAASPTFPNATRITAGDPGQSLVHQLIDERGAIQMPPIATFLIDTPDVANVAAWIAAMPPSTLHDAGVGGQGGDAMTDAAKD